MTNITVHAVVWNITNESIPNTFSRDQLWSLGCIVFLLSILSIGVWCSGMCKPRDDAYGNVHYNDVPQRTRLLDVLKSKARFLPMFQRLLRGRSKTRDRERLLANYEKHSSDESDYNDADIVYTRNAVTESHVIDL